MKLYNFAVGLVKAYLKLLYSVKIEGIENLPDDGGYLLVSNHKSNYDPLLIAAFTPVQLTFMAKQELFKIPVLGFLLKKFGAFPIKRGAGDLGAMRIAIKILGGGGKLLMFPEGTRCREEGKLLPGKPGAALLAHKAKVKIVPVGISGSYGFREKMTVKIGIPIDAENYFESKASSQALQDFTDNEIMRNIAQLCGDKYYGNICCG